MDNALETLHAHLRSWVGEWPPSSPGVHVVADPGRLTPTWDGSVRPIFGVSNGIGTVLSVRPDAADEVASLVADGFGDPALGGKLGELLGVGPARFGAGVFRTVTSAASIAPGIEDVGEWVEAHDDSLPEWLAPFNGPRLVVRDDDGGGVIASVGIKIHDRFGHEIAVVTEEAARGRGLARRLVATAARGILAQGAVPTYLHDKANVASAHVAEAVGFADEGWTIHGLWTASGAEASENR